MEWKRSLLNSESIEFVFWTSLSTISSDIVLLGFYVERGSSIQSIRDEQRPYVSQWLTWTQKNWIHVKVIFQYKKDIISPYIFANMELLVNCLTFVFNFNESGSIISNIVINISSRLIKDVEFSSFQKPATFYQSFLTFSQQAHGRIDP